MATSSSSKKRNSSPRHSPTQCDLSSEVRRAEEDLSSTSRLTDPSHLREMTWREIIKHFNILLRSIAYSVLFFPSVALLFLINSPALLLSRPPFYFARITSRYSLWLLKIICGLDYKIEGLSNIPKGPCIFASKHQSAWDTIVFQALYPDIIYVLKKELTYIPLYGQFIKKFGMIVIDRSRGRQALIDLRNQAKEVIKQGRKIVIFPEGTRTAPGQTNAYQKGIYALYKDCHCTVIPVTLNSGIFWGRRSWIKYPGVITLKFLSPMPEGLDGGEFMEQLSNRIEKETNDLLKIEQTNFK